MDMAAVHNSSDSPFQSKAKYIKSNTKDLSEWHQMQWSLIQWYAQSPMTPRSVIYNVAYNVLVFCKQQNSIGIWVYYQCVDAMSLCILNSITA